MEQPHSCLHLQISHMISYVNNSLMSNVKATTGAVSSQWLFYFETTLSQTSLSAQFNPAVSHLLKNTVNFLLKQNVYTARFLAL